MSINPSSRAGGWWLHVVLVILLSIPALAPLAFPGFYQNHNGLNPVYNLMSLASQLPNPGWSPIFGYGPDLLRGDAILPYAVAEFAHLLGLSFTDAVKSVYTLGLIFAAIGMFLLAYRVWKSIAAGFVAAVVYTYFPYHLALVYVRGAFGEAAAWALFPFALLAYAALRRKAAPAAADYVPTILAFALLLLCQPGLGLIMALAAVAIFELRDRVERRANRGARWSSAGVGLGVLIGLAALVPSILSSGVASSWRFVPAFVYPFQLLTATWGSALPRGSYLDEFPFQLGIGPLALAILAVALLYAGKNAVSAAIKRLVLLALVLAALLLLAMMPFAAPLWSFTGGTLVFEYPFQLLGLVAPALSLVAGSIAATDRQFARLPLLAALLAIPLLAGYLYLTPEFLQFTPSTSPVARFNDDELALLGARIIRPVGTLRHGASVDLELQWQAFRQVNHDYTVFVHAVDSSGKNWGGQDGKPQGGELSTLKWVPGRVISDTHTIQIDLNGPPEGYHLEVGLYTATTGERATTETGAGEVIIQQGGNQ